MAAPARRAGGRLIAPLLAAALAAAPLPDGAARRYRIEIGGEHAGWAALQLRCGGGRVKGCTVRWESRMRAPEIAGAAEIGREVEADVLPGGEAVRVRARVWDGLGERETHAGAGPIPSILAELLLAQAPPGKRECLHVRDEVSGVAGEACGVREGEWIAAELLGERVRLRAPVGEAPLEVLVPAQRIRFVADDEAALPADPPRLYGAEVPVAPEAERAVAAALGGGPLLLHFCGSPAEPRPRPLEVVPPGAWPEGASCREKTARYLAHAQAHGWRGRHVVGVAWDGSAFAWHEWAELLTGRGWIAVDPSFEQLPAEPPRFALARFDPGDEVAREGAGRRILACWGRARIEPGR